MQIFAKSAIIPGFIYGTNKPENFFIAVHNAEQMLFSVNLVTKIKIFKAMWHKSSKYVTRLSVPSNLWMVLFLLMLHI